LSKFRYPANSSYVVDPIIILALAYLGSKLRMFYGLSSNFDLSHGLVTLGIIITLSINLYLFQTEFTVNTKGLLAHTRFGHKQGRWSELVGSYSVMGRTGRAFVFVFSDRTKICIPRLPINSFRGELEKAIGKDIWDIDMRLFVKWPISIWRGSPIYLLANVSTFIIWSPIIESFIK
jgi:hypothetical protein